ncbi:MAG TPA: GAF domain-containing protein [bacterium]|nr:GAF domain-containing protein [bacterium]
MHLLDHQQIDAAVTASRVQNSEADAQSVCAALIEQVHALVPVTAAAAVRFDFRATRFTLEHTQNLKRAQQEGISRFLTELPVDLLRNEKMLQLELAALLDEILGGLVPFLPAHGATLVLPLIAGGRVLAAIFIAVGALDVLPPAQRQRLELLSAYAAASLQQCFADEEAEYQGWELSALYRLNTAMNNTLRFMDVAHTVVQEIAGIFKLDCAAILINEFGNFNYRESHGIARRKQLFTLLLEELQPHLRRLLQQKEEYLRLPGAEGLDGASLREGLASIRDLMVFPLVYDDYVAGALLLCSPQADYFQGRHLHLVRTIAGQVATAIKHARQYQQMERQLREAKLSGEIVKRYTREMQELNSKLQSRIRDLSTIYDITYAMSTQVSGTSLLDLIMDKILGALGTDKGSIMLYDDRSGTLDIRCARGMAIDDLKDLQLKPGEGVAGLALSTGEPIIVNDVLADARFINRHLTRDDEKYVAIGAFPLKIKNRVIGVLNIDKTSIFEIEETDLTKALTQFAASAIENARVLDELTDLFSNSIASLTATIEAKDPYTRGHSERVTRVSGFIGRQLNLPLEQQQMLERAAQLHDIGKVGIPALILGKKGRLTPEEYETIKDHAAMGARIISPIKKLNREMLIIRHHHERYDGNGYADGLAGEAIPYESRIISVADAFDAMVSTRSYRPAMKFSDAVAELERCAGSQFDPVIVRAFVAALHGREMEHWFRTEIDIPSPIAATMRA